MLVFLSPVPLVYYWCSQVVLFPQKATARVQGACSARPIETSCCCWFFAEHPSPAPAASCLLPPALTLSTYILPLFPIHVSSFPALFFPQRRVFCSKPCLYLGTALGWRRNVFQMGFFFSSFFVRIRWPQWAGYCTKQLFPLQESRVALQFSMEMKTFLLTECISLLGRAKM